MKNIFLPKRLCYGYTHYFPVTTAQKAIPKDCLDIIKSEVGEAYQKGIIQREYDEKKRPIVTESYIQFNGVGDEGHETFVFNPNNTEFNFCKTAQKQYDYVVMRVLVALNAFLDIDLGTDGDFDAEWKETLEYMREKYNLKSYTSILLTSEMDYNFYGYHTKDKAKYKKWKRWEKMLVKNYLPKLGIEWNDRTKHLASLSVTENTFKDFIARFTHLVTW